VVKGLRGFIQGYNAQAVTNEHQIVLAAEVMTAGGDFGHLEPMLDATRRELHAIGVEKTPGVVLVEAFRTGDAPPPLSWEPEGRAEFNRALFLNLMDTDWLPAIPDLDRRLRAEPPARVADVACGTGWSSIAMASAYPKIAVDGFDLDEDSIAAARRNAHDAGLGDRVTFSVSDASDSATVDRYDRVTIFRPA
jgi:hypothetical protein